MSNKLSADWDIDEYSILMFGEDFPCLCVQCWKPQRKTHIQDLNRIYIDSTVNSLFVIPCNVYIVQEVISSFSRNVNTLILIVPAVKRPLVLEEFPITVIFAAIPREDGSTRILFPLDNMLRRESHT